MANRKEYDRNRSKQLYDQFRQDKDRVCLEIMGGACYVCGNTEGANKYHLHHVHYHPTESNYERSSKSQWTRVQRVREATAHPERFKLLCGPCHRLVTALGHQMSRAGAKNKEKLLELVALQARVFES